MRGPSSNNSPRRPALRCREPSAHERLADLDLRLVGVGNGLLLGDLMHRSGLVPRRMAMLALIGGPLVCASGIAMLFDVFELGSAGQFIATIPDRLGAVAWHLPHLQGVQALAHHRDGHSGLTPLRHSLLIRSRNASGGPLRTMDSGGAGVRAESWRNGLSSRLTRKRRCACPRRPSPAGLPATNYRRDVQHDRLRPDGRVQAGVVGVAELGRDPVRPRPQVGRVGALLLPGLVTQRGTVEIEAPVPGASTVVVGCYAGPVREQLPPADGYAHHKGVRDQVPQVRVGGLQGAHVDDPDRGLRPLDVRRCSRPTDGRGDGGGESESEGPAQ